MWPQSMPEGDTIHRAALRLRGILEGQVVVAFASTAPALEGVDRRGRTVVQVEARGKHLFIHFDDGRALHTHLGMNGRWRAFRPTDRAKVPRSARVVLEVASALCVCTGAPTVELVSPRGLRRGRMLEQLGPDLLADSFDFDQAVARFRRMDHRPIAEVLLDQRVVSGIGNVYKSELLFLARLHPQTLVAYVADEALHDLLHRARDLLQKNVVLHRRATRSTLGTERTWVYGRRGSPCYVCKSILQRMVQGTALRSTYFCPTCQPRLSSQVGEAHKPG